MSWRKRFLNVSLVGLCLLANAGCGFSPMYGKYSADPKVTSELASIQIDPLTDRPGQMLHNALLTRLNPRGEPDAPRYRLHTYLSISESQVALQKDSSATRAILTYQASYYLYQDQTPITYGSVTRTLSYDFLVEHYADISAAQDVRSRGAQVVAEEIRNQLAAYFIRKQQTGDGGGTP